MALSNRVYKDLVFTFNSNPMGGDVGISSGATAVKRAMVSIMNTNFKERLFQPDFGSGIRDLLFEQMNPITEENIKQAVLDCIEAHEPRADVLGVTVEGQEDKNRYKVSILFNVTSTSQPQQLETYFERV